MRERLGRAIAELRPTLPRLYQIGSHANVIYSSKYISMHGCAEQNNEALHLLEKRVAARRYIPSIQCGLALTYNKLG